MSLRTFWCLSICFTVLEVGSYLWVLWRADAEQGIVGRIAWAILAVVCAPIAAAVGFINGVLWRVFGSVDMADIPIYVTDGLKAVVVCCVFIVLLRVALARWLVN